MYYIARLGTGSVLVMYIVLYLLAYIGHTLACPSVCFCNPVTKIAYCSRKNLPFIPEGIPSHTQQLNLNNNNFENRKLVRTNFTAFKFLEHLYMSGCGIEEISVNSFADLRKLKWLDLSNNLLKRIEDFTFKGLHLDHLFLNSNPSIQLNDYAFSGLRTSGLYLHSSALKNFSLTVIKPLNGTVRALWLDENLFERLNSEWFYVFNTLSHLRLGHNPFHCNCEIAWLRDFYATNSSVFSGAIPPACDTPPRLRGRFFTEMLRDEFSCQLPVFNKIDISLNVNDGELTCSASGDPTPRVVWVNPQGKPHVFNPPKDVTIKQTTAVMRIFRKKGVGKEHYSCVAKNPAGDVSLSLNVSWPVIPEPEIIIQADPEKPNDGRGNFPPYDSTWEGYKPSKMGDTSAINATPTKETEQGNFTVVRLVCAVVGTFLLTMLLCIITFHFYYKHQAEAIFRECKEREKTPDNVYITSELDGEQAIKMINHHHHHYNTPENYDPQETPS